MVKLEAGNVLLKPSHRRQLMGWLRRPQRLSERLGNLDLTITLNRIGNQHEARASIQEAAGNFTCRSRQRDWRGALRDMVHQVTNHLHSQQIQRTMA